MNEKNGRVPLLQIFASKLQNNNNISEGKVQI
jgi:hypothetical protein